MRLRDLLDMLMEIKAEIGCSTPFICGGTPRDKWSGNLDKVSDIDITTGDKTIDYLMEEFSAKLNKKYNIKKEVMKDGHSTLYIGNLKMDFSSNFILPGIEPVLTAKGFPNSTSMQQEMFSRDFTCNSLLLSLDFKNLLDPTKQGMQDIKDKKIRTCLDPKITLTSYPNRVVRAIYLAAKLGFDVDESIIQYVRQNPKSVNIAWKNSLIHKLEEAFTWDAEKAAHLITQMGLWKFLPISEKMKPYYRG